MKIRSERFKEEGLVREAVKNGFGDLRVVIGKVEIKTFKFVLCICNETLGKLLRDPLFEEPLMLSEDCSVSSFYLLERYYEGLEIELNESNSVELLLLCVYYNEEILLKEVMKYLENHLNEEIMIQLLNIREILKNDKLNELRDKFENYLKNKNDKLMKMNYLSRIEIESVKYLFGNGILYNGNEIDLLKLLLDYYRIRIRDEDEKEEMRLLMKKCKFGNETYEKLNNKYKRILKELRISNDDENEKYSIRYCPIPKIENEILYYILIKNYPIEDIQEISFEKSELLLLSKEDISNDINILLKSKEIKLIMLMLRLCDSLNIKIDLSKHINTLDFLLYYCKLSDEYKQKLLLKRIMNYIYRENSKKIFDRMKKRNGIELLFNLVKDNNLLNRNTNKLLMNYFHEIRLNENEYKLMNLIIEDEETKRMIIYRELKSISYPKNNYQFLVGEKVYVVATINDINEVEEITIEPNLPCGLSFDRKTGVISGIPNEECYTTFTITAKNIWNEVNTKLELGIIDKIHFDETTISGKGKLDYLNKTFTLSERVLRGFDCICGCCCLNIKLEKGIYHFVLRIKAYDFGIGARKNNYKEEYDFCWYSFGCIYYKDKNGKENSDFRKSIEVKNDEYEIIFDMNKRTFSIKDKYGIIHELLWNIRREIYPFIEISHSGTSCELLKSWIE